MAALEWRATKLQVNEDELAEMGIFERPRWSFGPSREEWRELEVTGNAERVRRVEEKRFYFQRVIREKLLDDWLDKHTTIQEDFARNVIKFTVTDYLRAEQVQPLKDYLLNLARFGFDKAQKKLKAEQRGGGYAGHVWAGVVRLLRIILAVAVLSVASSKFETVVLALLILIYVTIQSEARLNGYLWVKMALGIDNQFANVFRRIGRDEIDREARLEAEQSCRREANRGVIRYHILQGSLGLTWTVVMARLFWVLLS